VTVNKATLDLMKEFEGLRLKAYPDPGPLRPLQAPPCLPVQASGNKHVYRCRKKVV
jgi:hypothetical protein